MSSQSEKPLCFGYDKKEQLRCMLCGGKECSKCGLEAYKKVSEPAIDLLHSHWITDKIVGMQRPNESSLVNGALDDMVKKKITAIFNLTEPGEHPYCGCGTLSISGFPYIPETVMAKGVKHFNFNWPDMTVPSLDTMDRIVSIACNEIQSGGKIAVHCHAGFGRTGLAIACILIANDHLSADSVITFVRNRRPGSIQTAAQQQFIHRYERHRNLMMQIFPTYEEVDDNKFGTSKGKAFIAYPKSIAGSVEDQLFFSQIDQLKPEYRYAHKVVYLTSRAISRLSFDHFSVACLAITGLNKLTVKRNSIDAGRDIDNYAARAESLASRPQLLRKKSSFMVATNSLSESSEETMLTEIKLELNQNNYTRVISMSDVISADFRAKGESLSKLEHKVSQQVSVAGSTSLRSLSKRSLNGSQRGLGVREPSFQHTGKDATRSVNNIIARQSSITRHATTENTGDAQAHSGVQHQKSNEAHFQEKKQLQTHHNQHLHQHDKVHNQEHKDQSSHSHHPFPNSHQEDKSHDLNGKHNDKRIDFHSKDHLAHNKQQNHDPHFHHDPHHHIEQHHIERSNSAYQPSNPHHQSNHSPPHHPQQHTDQVDTAIATIDKEKATSEILSTPESLSLKITPLTETTVGEDAADALIVATVSQSHTHNSSHPTVAVNANHNNDREKRSSFSARERNLSSPSIPKMSLPSPGSLIRGLSARSVNDISQSNMSGNNTQRSNASMSSVTSPLTAIRANSLRMNTEQDYAKSKKMAANLLSQLLLDWLETRSDALFSAEDVNNLQDIWAKYGGIPKVTDDKLSDECSSQSISEKVPTAATASAVPVASSPGEIQEDFYEEDLIQAVYTLLAQHLSRYKLELLSLLVEMYRFIRLAGFDNTAKLQVASADQSNCHSPMGNGAAAMLFGSAESAGSETQALDALVGLRLAIACMHARKKNSSLVRRRGLIIDLVKVFLLKSSSSEYVIINNITFSAENFAQIQHNIGIVLLGQIDVVFRTLNLLVDTQWSSSWKRVRGKHRGRIFDANRVGWRENDNNVLDFSTCSK